MDALLTTPALAPLTTSLGAALASAPDPRWYPGPWHGGPGPWLLVPLLFWAAVITAVVLVARRRRGRSGEAALRDAFARGEVDEAAYRARLAVLRETRR